MNEVEEKLQIFLIERSASILKVPEDAVSWDADVDEYGFDSMRVNQLCFEISRHFGIYLQPAVFLESSSLEAVSRFLMERFPQPIERKLL
jgi:acyl carrier protein